MNLLIKIISNYINNNNCMPGIKPEEVDLLMQDADAHQLIGVVYDYLMRAEGISPDVLFNLNLYKLKVYHSIFDCKSKLAYSEKVFNVFNEQSINYVLLKGLMFKTLYPNPDVRTMSDIDILVDTKDIDSSIKILNKLGYVVNETKEHECNFYLTHPLGMPIELHHKLFSESVFGKNLYLDENIFNQKKHIKYKGIMIYVPNHAYALSYAILHMAKHFAVTGFGIRQLLDITLFMDANKDHIDYCLVENILKKYGVLLFSSYLIGLCNKCFDKNFTTFDIEASEDKLNYIFDCIMKAGVFGHQFKENDIESEYLLRMQSSKGRLKSPLVAKVGLILPKRTNLGERYIYARRHKMLLPLAWLHRIIYNIFNKNDIAKKFLKETPDDEKLENRLEILKYFNLHKKF